jgi:hypothetical protein
MWSYSASEFSTESRRFEGYALCRKAFDGYEISNRKLAVGCSLSIVLAARRKRPA